jgi:C4-dicarboxylate-specific signal transduction histidine kinase
MTPRQQPLQLSKEGRMSLAITSIQNNPYQAKRTLAAAFNVLESTLRTRLRGILSRHKTKPVNVKMTPVKEQSLV